ncbi:MAG: hypothetical protein QOE97_2726 [Pseudonocardiales bacterium]|jgi:hypothetical protein|nr:hypothetical protein [Pseudonocardiales bacterium]
MVLPGGAFHDYVLPADDIPSLLDSWGAGPLGTFNGETLTVEWLDQPGSKRIRTEMGVPH